MTKKGEQDVSLEHARANDSMLRKVVVSVAVAIFIQALGWIYMLGSLTNQVNTNTKMIEKSMETDISIVRIETLVEGIVTSINTLTKSMSEIGREQNRRALIIDRADRFMEKHQDDKLVR